MDNTQQQLLDLIVDQVLAKHGVKKDRDITSKDKKRLSKVVEKLKKDVENFKENEKKTYTEDDSR